MADPAKREQRWLQACEPPACRSLMARFRVVRLLQRFDQRCVWAVFMLVNGCLTIGLLAGMAVLSGTPLVFPSLGAAAFLFFFDPITPSATPRHAVIGHAIGICCGYAALTLFGLQHAGSAMAVGVTAPRALAAALSLGTTGAFMILLRAPHPPGGATTLIVSLGAMTRPTHLVLLELAVAALALQAIAINRLAGLDYPLWTHRKPLGRAGVGRTGPRTARRDSRVAD